jgi:hypothetical protein
MKKLLFLGLLSLSMVFSTTPGAQAWFDCCRSHCCSKYSTKLCIRPYNAFSPVAYGTIVGEGCMPINVFGGQLPPMPRSYMGMGGMGMGMDGGCCAAPSCFTSGCCEGGCLPPAGSFTTSPQQMVPGQAMPTTPGPQFNPPNPQPLNQGMYMMPMQTPMGYNYGYGPVQPASYQQPLVNPYYYSMPANYYGQPQAPSYWYGH